MVIDPQTFRKRRGVIHLGIQLALLALCIRTAVIQCLHKPRYASLAEGMERTIVRVEPRRGHILDRRGKSFAVTTGAPSVWANPRAVPSEQRREVAEALAGALSLDADKIAERLARRKYFVWIKRKVTDPEAEAVAALELHGIGSREEPCRRYPNGTLLCHVLGFVGMDGKGLAGLERAYDHVLAGTPGEEVLLRDGRGRTLGSAGAPDTPVEHGRSLILTIDAGVQQIVEEELAAVWEEHKPETLAAVVMDPWTGDVLGMAGQPLFRPAAYGDGSPAAWKNMAVMDCVEPGSSFKPFVVAAALAHGVVTPETIFNCHRGSYRIGRRTLHDAHPLGYLSVRDVIAYSSNIGMAQIGARLSRDQLHDALGAFGFGRPTGIGLPGESAGILHPVPRWSGLSMSSLAMGQEVSVSVLQLTAGFCVFANGGWYVRPRLILGIADQEGGRFLERAGEPECRRVLAEDVARLMCNDLLVGVIERGTARRAAIDGYRLAGKTGTAQIARTDGRGYEPGAYSATFVGIAPADEPMFVIGLIAKRPRGGSHYGGVVAAPAVARIAERLLASCRMPRSAPPPAHRFVSVH